MVRRDPTFRGLAITLAMVAPLLALVLVLSAGGAGEQALAQSASPAAPVRPVMAPQDGGTGRVIGRAIFALGTCTPHTLDLGGSYQYIVGGMHSNGNITIWGNAADPSYISGPVEYAGEIMYSEDQVIFDNPPDNQPVQVAMRTLPLLYPVDDYDLTKSGAKAIAADLLGEYHYYANDGGGSAPSLTAADGLHFSADPHGFLIPSDFPSDTPFTMTLVTEGPVRFQASTVLTPYVDGLLVLTTFGYRDCPSNETAVTLAGNRMNWHGLVYAPNGHIDLSAAANSSLVGVFAGWTADISGSQLVIIYEARYDPLTIGVNDVAVLEGNVGTITATFVVTLSAVSELTVTVDYATADGTAVSGTDYIPVSGTLSFAPGQTSQAVDVAVRGDVQPEPAETFAIELDRPSNAIVIDSVGVGTILNDDYPTSAVVGGTVFEDTDGNGVADAGEGGLEGVLVSLSTGISTATDLYGRYALAVSETGCVWVSETDPNGYHSTTPNTVTVDVAELGESYEVNFGDNPNPNVSSIFGTVFHDLNVNGARELIEPPLVGVTVTLTSAAGPYVTNEWGQYTFQVDSTGVYTVTESDTPGYVSTNAIPGDPAVTKVDNNTLRADMSTLGGDLGDNQFGDVVAGEVITISGTVWDDNGAGGGVAADGVRNGTEPGLARAVISLSSGLTGATGWDGAFWLVAPAGEVITVSEANPAGYVSTGAQAGDGATRVNNDTLTVSGLGAGATSSGNQFLDVLPADLVVVKSDHPDPVAAGGALTYTIAYTNYGPSAAQDVSITDTLPAEVVFGGILSTSSQPPSYLPRSHQLLWYTPTLTAGASGSVVFTVTVSPAATGWITNGVVITSGIPDTDASNNRHDESTDIGDPDLATLYGYVFEDADGDGLWDTGEAGISDVTIALDGDITTTTDADGLYVFIISTAGAHTVVETDLPAYFSTTPNEVHVEATLGNSYRADFGDVPALTCTCPPDFYEEDDEPAQAAVLTPGPRQAHDFCTDATDWFTFTGRADQVVTLTTSSWGQRADTFLALFDTGGQTLLAANDDYEGTTDYSSRIVWEPSADGVYYLQATNRGGLQGCYTDYEIWLEEREVTSTFLYLPTVARDCLESPDVLPSAAPNLSVTAGPLAPEEPELDALGIISHTCPDAYELDDTWELARPITDLVQIHSFDSDPVQFVPDKDFVWFVMPRMGAITFTVSATNTTTFMELYDEFGTALAVTGYESLVWGGDPLSRYYLSEPATSRRVRLC